MLSGAKTCNTKRIHFIVMPLHHLVAKLTKYFLIPSAIAACAVKVVFTQEKTFRGIQRAKKNSVTRVQRSFVIVTRCFATTKNPIYTWCEQYETEEWICKGKCSGHPLITDERNVPCVRESFQYSPWKSAYRCSHQLNLPQTTLWHIPWQHLFMKACKLQLIQALKPNDKHKYYNFCWTLKGGLNCITWQHDRFQW